MALEKTSRAVVAVSGQVRNIQVSFGGGGGGGGGGLYSNTSHIV